MPGKQHSTDDMAGARRGCTWGVIHRAELERSLVHPPYIRHGAILATVRGGRVVRAELFPDGTKGPGFKEAEACYAGPTNPGC